MQDLLPFLIHHWPLSLAFIAVLGIIIFEERRSAAPGGFALTPAAVVNLINREKAVVIDLRTAEQFQVGHIVEAIHLDYAELEEKFKSLQKYQQRPLIIVCPLNKSATLVMTKIRKAGFPKAQLLAGGMDAWTKADLPLVKK